MKPFRKHAAIAIDGGGIRGVMVARALAMLEKDLGKPVYEVFELAAGTSTGSIISAAIACRISAVQIYELYCKLGETIFERSLRYWLWPITRHRYSASPLVNSLHQQFGDRTLGEIWTGQKPIDLVITAFDVVANRTRFLKPWKEEYRDWPVYKAVLASSSPPTYFPVVDGQYVDGGVGSYANPCYLAAYEAKNCLKWDPAETTLVSLGTGREPHRLAPGSASRFWAWDWISPVLGAFSQSADDQQVHLVQTFFETLDFRRFQLDLNQPIGLDDSAKIPQLAAYGEDLGRMIINDITDPVQKMISFSVPKSR